MKFLVALLVSFFVFFLLPPIFIFAQEDLSPTAVPITVTKPPYELPYPGLLPDSPLYVLKVARDKIVSFLITDPLEKARFDIAVSDKRLNSALYLLKEGKGKEELALSTISKGENYLEEAIAKTEEAKKQGAPVDEILNRLTRATEEHKRIMTGIEKKIPASLTPQAENRMKRMSELEKRVKAIRNR